MADYTLTKTQLKEGVWEGVLTSEQDGNQQPELRVTHNEALVSGVKITEDSDHGIWTVRVPVPVQLLSDGVQTFLVQDIKTGETLSSFAILSGDAVDDDIRTELELLRAELDMLKRAFRRHCVETM